MNTKPSPKPLTTRSGVHEYQKVHNSLVTRYSLAQDSLRTWGSSSGLYSRASTSASAEELFDSVNPLKLLRVSKSAAESSSRARSESGVLMLRGMNPFNRLRFRIATINSEPNARKEAERATAAETTVRGISNQK